MHIVHLHRTEAAAGGGRSYVIGAIDALRMRGHHSVLLTVGANGELPAIGGLASGVRHRERIVRRIAAEGPDVVHLHGVYGLLSAPILRAIIGRWPTVMTVHHVAPLCFRDTKLRRASDALCALPFGLRCMTSGCHRPWRPRETAGLHDLVVRWWQLAEYRRLERVIVSSRYLEHELLRNGVSRERLVRLPMPSMLAAGPCAPPSRSRRILFVGRLSPEKGAAVLLEALGRLVGGDWEATVVGAGPEDQRLRDLACRRGIAGRIHFAGACAHSALPDHYRDARILVVPSTGPETFGLAGVEAMGFGRPVVASDAGGTGEWLDHGRTGLLVPWRDPVALAGALEQLLGDDRETDRLGRAARQEALARFSGDRHIDDLIEVYAGACDARARPGDTGAAGRTSSAGRS